MYDALTRRKLGKQPLGTTQGLFLFLGDRTYVQHKWTFLFRSSAFGR